MSSGITVLIFPRSPLWSFCSSQLLTLRVGTCNTGEDVEDEGTGGNGDGEDDADDGEDQAVHGAVMIAVSRLGDGFLVCGC